MVCEKVCDHRSCLFSKVAAGPENWLRNETGCPSASLLIDSQDSRLKTVRLIISQCTSFDPRQWSGNLFLRCYFSSVAAAQKYDLFVLTRGMLRTPCRVHHLSGKCVSTTCIYLYTGNDVWAVCCVIGGYNQPPIYLKPSRPSPKHSSSCTRFNAMLSRPLVFRRS